MGSAQAAILITHFVITVDLDLVDVLLGIDYLHRFMRTIIASGADGHMNRCMGGGEGLDVCGGITEKVTDHGYMRLGWGSFSICTKKGLLTHPSPPTLHLPSSVTPFVFPSSLLPSSALTPTHSLIHSFIHSFTHSVISSFHHSLIHSLIH